jgi:hypothetical protein
MELNAGFSELKRWSGRIDFRGTRYWLRALAASSVGIYAAGSRRAVPGYMLFHEDRSARTASILVGGKPTAETAPR